MSGSGGDDDVLPTCGWQNLESQVGFGSTFGLCFEIKASRRFASRTERDVCVVFVENNRHRSGSILQPYVSVRSVASLWGVNSV